MSRSTNGAGGGAALERELRETLGRFAPDATEFEAAVRRRVTELEAAGLADDGAGGAGDAERERMRSEIVRSPLLRRAAAFLPPGLLVEGLALPAAAAAGKHAGWKGLVALAGVPALSVMMLAAAFAGGLGSTGRLRGDGGIDPREARIEAVYWWRIHWWKGLLGLALLVGLFLTQPTEAVVALLVGSMVVVALVLRHLSAVGAASRAAVASYTSRFLWTVALYGFLFTGGVWSYHLVPRGGDAFLVLAGGAAGCLALGRLRPGRPLARSPWIWTSAVLMLGGLTGTLTPGPLDRAECGRWLERFGARAAQTPEWNRFGLVAGNLPAETVAALDLSRARARIETAFEKAESPSDVAPTTLVAAARAGLLSPAHLAALAAERRTQQLLQRESKIHFSTQYEPALAALGAGGLSEAQRAHLAKRLLASVPEPEKWDALDSLAAIARGLDAIGAGERAPELVEPAHRTLVAHWTGRARSSGPAPFDRSAERVDEHKSEFFYDESTAHAVELLARFGVPAELDAERVRDWLVATASAPSWLPIPVFGADDHDFVAAAALDLLDRTVPRTPVTGIAARIARERVLIGCALLAALCLWATARAALGERAREH